MSKGCIGVIEADIEEVATGPGVVVGELHEGRTIETHELHAVCRHEACMPGEERKVRDVHGG